MCCILFFSMILAPSTGMALPKASCKTCHQAISVTSPPHGNLECTDCHTNIQRIPHQKSPLKELSGSDICSRCHKDAVRVVKESIHAAAAGCQGCHGEAHQILRVKDPASPMSPMTQIKTCGQCHDATPGLIDGYLQSVHGKAMVIKRFVTAPTCTDCHGSHGIFPPSDSRSTVFTKNVPQTCGTCHREILKVWTEQSAHGQAWKKGQEGPVCITCHNSHQVQRPSTGVARLKMPETCGGCHGGPYWTYRDTFHGRATDLGFLTAATCSDCHTPHQQLAAKDPHSSVNPNNLGKTCGKCHANIRASFLTFHSHLDPKDPSQDIIVHYIWLLMTVLLAGVFGFFGLHTVLWFQRSLVGFFKGEFTEIRKPGERYIRRFSSMDIWVHVTIVVSFLLLAATGLPLKFHYTEWAKNLASFLGGVGSTRFLHRFAAIVTFGYGAYHLGYLFHRVFQKQDLGILWGWRSMVPRWKDLVDLWHNFRYFIYLGPRPQIDRWSYWEKFDYLAVFWGIPMIGFSGLMLWLPRFFTYVLPGWALNAAFIIHSDESLLAVGYIFLFHFFHTHLRPESFPMDPVIFTGRVSLDRFKEERPTEYKRLVETGELEGRLVSAPSTGQKWVAYIFGFTTLTTGLVLLLLILWALFVY